MGNWFTRSNIIDLEVELSSTDESDSNEEESVNQNNLTMKRPNAHLDTDAVGNPKESPNSISLSDVVNIENDLDEYEKISLIFLLSENPKDCLNKVSISKWATNEMSNTEGNWQSKLLEALVIIKNFQVLKKYGFTKNAVIKRYFPFAYYSTEYVSNFRKVLYCVCEELNAQNERQFLHYVKGDLRNKGLPIFEYSQLELYLSDFLRIGYITKNNVTNLKTIFKRMDLESICIMLEVIHKSDNEVPKEIFNHPPRHEGSKLITNISVDDQPPSNDHCFSAAFSDIWNSTQDNVHHGLSNNSFPIKSYYQQGDAYRTSGKKIAFIIDQEVFYTAFEEEYKDLLPPNHEKDILHERRGTEIDSNRLKSTLEKRNFCVELKRNRTHLEMISDLKNCVDKIDGSDCCCLFVSILSHGTEGVVYGCNSCHVEISSIIQIMSAEKLRNIPKVLILQSCQGAGLQTTKVKTSLHLDTDGPSSIKSVVVLKDPDFLIFFSTVPGFASVRDKTKGTWFIQSLCNQMDMAQEHEHFGDICTKVQNEISIKTWPVDEGTYSYMVPVKWTTLTKKLTLFCPK